MGLHIAGDIRGRDGNGNGKGNGTNTAAVISGVDSGSVTEDVDPDADGLLETTGKLTITDPDPGEKKFTAATSSGTYGSLTIETAGDWNYAVQVLHIVQALVIRIQIGNWRKWTCSMPILGPKSRRRR